MTLPDTEAVRRAQGCLSSRLPAEMPAVGWMAEDVLALSERAAGLEERLREWDAEWRRRADLDAAKVLAAEERVAALEAEKAKNARYLLDDEHLARLSAIHARMEAAEERAAKLEAALAEAAQFHVERAATTAELVAALEAERDDWKQAYDDAVENSAEVVATLEAERDGLQHQYDAAVNQWYAYRERAATLEAERDAATETLRALRNIVADAEAFGDELDAEEIRALLARTAGGKEDS